MLRDALVMKGLSHREAEVVEWVCKGFANKDVAKRLFITEKTVKFHLKNIYKKMAVKSRAQLMVWCHPHLDFVEPVKDIPVVNPPIDDSLPRGPSGSA